MGEDLKDKVDSSLRELLEGRSESERTLILDTAQRCFTIVQEVIASLRNGKPPSPEHIPQDDTDEEIEYQESYSVDEAVALLKKTNSFYRPAIVRRMLNQGHLTKTDDERITGVSLKNHVKYMKGKRFLDTIPAERLEYMLEESNKVRPFPLTEKMVLEQIRRGCVDVIGYGSRTFSNRVEAVSMSDDEILEMLKRGTWMTTKEIKGLGCEDSKQTISNKLRDNTPIFRTKLQYGKTRIGYVTTESLDEIFDLIFEEGSDDTPPDAPPEGTPDDPAKGQAGSGAQAPTDPKDLLYIKICGIEESFDPNKEYSDEDMFGILYKVHSGVFSNIGTVEKVVKKIGRNGSEFYEFVKSINGLMPIQSKSTQNYLEGKIGKPYEKEISDLLLNPEFRRFVHRMPDAFYGEYILEGETDDLVSEAKAYYKSIDEAIEECKGMLKAKRRLPRGKIYESLLHHKVFDHSSPEIIRETYQAFDRAMNGFYFYNFGRVREELELSWSKFKYKMKEVIEKGFARDIVGFLRIKSSFCFYVLANGMEDEVYKALETQ
jgi:hypothetical protein